jgi:hypothetical protein
MRVNAATAELPAIGNLSLRKKSCLTVSCFASPTRYTKQQGKFGWAVVARPKQ